MEYQVTTPQGIEVTLTFSHNDEFGGMWFTDGDELYFAHNPEHPDSTDPIVCLSYDYIIMD